MNVFQGEGVSLTNCFYCIFILYIAGVGVNSGKQTWLRKVHSGWVSGGGDFDF